MAASLRAAKPPLREKWPKPDGSRAAVEISLETVRIGKMDSVPEDFQRRGVVGVVMRDHHLLVIRRARGVVAPLVYCFPGGGIEGDESEEEALIREFREEVGVTLQPLRWLWGCVTSWNVHLAWWLGEIDADAVPVANPLEVESIHWLTVEEMGRMRDLLSSNREFLELVKCGEIALPR
jgi:8-oxo-dGTP pyrophosphatase MutT (NUDIX family)